MEIIGFILNMLLETTAFFFLSCKNSSTIFSTISATRNGDYWIGLKDVVGDNKISSYRWLKDGSSVSFVHWVVGEPYSSAQRCVVQYSTGRWNDVDCKSLRGAICELSVSIPWD